MIKRTFIQTTNSNNGVCKHLFMRQDDITTGLIVMFQGAKYSYDRPLLHYLRKLALHNSYDVLCINYSERKVEHSGNLDVDHLAIMAKDAINESCNGKEYNTVISVSKSIGTLIAGKAQDYFKEGEVKNIWLTPIMDSIEYITKNKGLVITGENDKLFGVEGIKKLDFQGVDIKIIQGASHSLEVDDVFKTINIHKDVISYCKELFKEGV